MRNDICETDEHIKQVYHNTRALFKARHLLPTVVDCDGLNNHTTNQMPAFLRVLGVERFCKHIWFMYTLVETLRTDPYEAFCDLCTQEEGGLNPNDLT